MFWKAGKTALATKVDYEMSLQRAITRARAKITSCERRDARGKGEAYKPKPGWSR